MNSFIRRLKIIVKKVIGYLDFGIAKLCVKNGFLASLYYTFFNWSFYREHSSVLEGRLAYWDSFRKKGYSSFYLRRNTHRIEKGLVMTPRKPVFAESYIVETVKCYKKGVKEGHIEKNQKKWVRDVLKEYFKVVSETPTIKKARNEFEELLDKKKKNGMWRPYPHHELPELSFGFNELKTLFQRRRSVRWYEQRKVPESKLQKAINAASYAPSACNRQPFEYYVTNNPDKATEVAKCAGGTKGFAENLPCVIAVVGNLNAYPNEPDRHLIYIDASLANMQLMLALETLGLSTCPINWRDVAKNERMISKLLGLKKYQRTIMLMAVGYAETTEGIPFSQKKESEILMKKV